MLIFVFLLHSAHAVFLDSHLYIVAVIIVVIITFIARYSNRYIFRTSGLLGFPLSSTRTQASGPVSIIT